MPNLRFVTDSFRILWSNKKSRMGLLITLFFVLLVTLGTLLLRPPEINASAIYQPPSWKHLLGTDYMGEDLLSMIAHGGGYILEIALFTGVISIGIGAVVGLSAGYFGRKVEGAITAITDVALTIPGLILIIVLLQFVKTTNPIILAALISVVAWAGFARAVKSQILVLRNQSFIEAAKMLSLSRRHILFSELLPNVMPYVAINFIFTVQSGLFVAVGLYYLGVLPYTSINWGVMLNAAVSQGAFLSSVALPSFIVPLAAITLFTVGLILLSFGLDEVFNPRLR